MVVEEEKMKGEEEKMIPCAEMAKSLNGETAIGAINLKSEGSYQNDRRVCPSSTKKTCTAENKGRSCKGCLYYSLNRHANSRNPLCVGLSRSLPNVPHYVAGDSIQSCDEGENLVDFRYGCVGYSHYKDQKGSDGQQTRIELPVCVGFKLLMKARAKAADSEPVPSHVLNKEGVNKLPHNRSPKQTNATEQEFVSRFARNANLVANGVAKNMRRVGNRIKQSLNDFLFPYRRPPK